MRVRLQRYTYPKRGSSDAEYEDAVACNPAGCHPRRFAVADGASESSFARLWAELLVGAYVRGGLSGESLDERLRPLQAQWSAEVAARPLPWYAVEKARSGAFAALVGLTIHEEGVWQALAAGDCCVLHVRDDHLVRSFPLESAGAFEERPRLLSSNSARNEGLADIVVEVCDRWQPGDQFLLMSDALAATVLQRVVEKGEPVGAVLPFRGQQNFRRWIDARRDGGSLRNDDVSLLRLTVV